MVSRKRKSLQPWWVVAFAFCFANFLHADTFGLFSYTDYGTYITITRYPTTASGSVVIPDAIIGKPVTAIASAAFNNCSRVTDITIPSSVNSISSYAFQYCTSLTSITLSSRLTVIESYLFKGCISLTSVTIPYGVTRIYSDAFNGCSGLTTVVMPSTVRNIYSWAFRNCASLTNVFIPSSVTFIGLNVFVGSNNMASVTVDPMNTAYSSVDGILYNKFQTSLVYCPVRKVGNITILPTVTVIGDSAFGGCGGLTGVVVPSGVTYLGESAFQNCSNLAEIEIPTGVTSIMDTLFNGCRSLTSVSIPSNVTSIGVSSFRDCTRLTSVTIPTSVKTIGESAFRDCFNLGNAAVPTGVTSIGISAFSGCINLTSVALPSSLTSIGSSAFSACASLTAVTIPTGVTTIGSSAFSGCTSLTSVAIPSAVTTLGSFAFRYCDSLTNILVDSQNSNYAGANGILFNKTLTTLMQCPGGKSGIVTVPSGTTSVDTYAFAACAKLSGVTIPASVTSIGSQAFFGCSVLTDITVDPSNANYSSGAGVLFDKTQATLIQCPGGKAGSVTILPGVSSVGSSAFQGCGLLADIVVNAQNTKYSSAEGILFDKTFGTLLQCPGGKAGSVTIPSNVTSIAASAFSGCIHLTGVTIPSSVLSIGDSSFEGCDGLTGIFIPSGVATIGNFAFRFCDSLSGITVAPSNTAFTSGDGILYDKIQSTLILCPQGKGGAITIPSGVKTLNDYAFYGCAGLTSVLIPSSVTQIGTFAFRDCGNLASAVFIGSAPSIWGIGWFASFGSNFNGFAAYHFDGKSGFTAPKWMGYPVVKMGAVSSLSPWLVSNGFPHDMDPQADPNGDGVNLLLAYATALDPRQNLSASLPRAAIVGNQMSLTYYAGSEGITYVVETSEDLENWSNEGVILSTPDTNGYRVASHPGGGSSRFMRLSVSN